MKTKLWTILLSISLSLIASQALAATYYVSPTGNDSNSGISSSSPWRSLSKVNNSSFSPGDIISFQRNSTWTGGLVINSSGVQGSPITFTAYGDGERPIIRNPGTWTKSIVINGDYVIVENFLLRDSNQAGVHISQGANHNIVRLCEFTNTGCAVEFLGSNNLATQNIVHDMAMVVNTYDGPPPGADNDYGANGFIVNNSQNNEISYNTIWNCYAESYDYGTDGGVLELFNNVDGTYFHHNYASESDLFVEVGGRNGSAHNVTIAYNVSVNNHGRFASLHNTDQWSSDIRNFRIENNTIIETKYDRWVLVWLNSTPRLGDLIFRNNIAVLDVMPSFSNVLFDRSNNLFHFLKSINLVGGLQSHEAYGDPLFVNMKGGDYKLQANSPAIDKGADLGYSFDYNNQAVPSGPVPDLGAHEYQANGATPSPPMNLRVIQN